MWHERVESIGGYNSEKPKPQNDSVRGEVGVADTSDDAHTVAVQFHYADQTLMQYADILVFSPSDKKVEHQNGRTDKNGIFAFRPDGPGTWVIEANDGMGHREQAELHVEQPAPSEAPQAVSETRHVSSRTVGGIAGLRLLLNISLAAYLLKQRSESTRSRPRA